MVAMYGLRRVVRRRLRPDMPGPQVRGAQGELLLVVEAEPHIGVAAAARTLHLAGNTVSTLVNQLVDAGMLLREVDPTDRRAVRLVLTDAATARLDRWRRARSSLVGEALQRLSPEDVAALDAAVPALQHLLDELSKELP